MSERAWLLAEALGHWLLAWTLVVLAVVLWIRIQRPRRPAIRYGGWLLATFAGAALLPARRRGGASRVLERCVGPPSPCAVGSRSIRKSNCFPILVRQSPDFFSTGIGHGERGTPGRYDRDGHALRSRRATPSRIDPYAASLVDRPLMFALGIWSAGFLVFAGRLFWSALRIRSLLAGLEPIATEGLETELDSARRALRIRRRSASALTRRLQPQCASVCSVRSSSGRRRRTVR